MKKLLTTLFIVAATFVASAQTIITNSPGGVWGTISDFFANNPTNTFDLTGYGIYDITTKGAGGGARVGYWITPSVGAALDVGYCDSSWTFANLGLSGRGTVKLGDIANLTLHASAGPGWNINGQSQSVVVFASTGGTLHINKWKYFDFLGEYQHVTTEANQDRVIFGLTRKF